MLALPIGREQFEGPKIAAAMNLLLDKRPDVDDLYYFWCFDPNYQSFRVTNFFNYCPSAVRQNAYPICVEFFLDPKVSRDEASVAKLALEDLTAFGIIPPETRVLCTAGNILPVGFPILSCHNRELLAASRREIASLGIDNLAITGIQSEWGVVFQPDVLVHTYRTVCSMEGPCL